jgi:hypothetical protein
LIVRAIGAASTIEKEQSIAVSIVFKRQIAVSIVVGAHIVNFQKDRLGNPENDPVGVDLALYNLL